MAPERISRAIIYRSLRTHCVCRPVGRWYELPDEPDLCPLPEDSQNQIVVAFARALDRDDFDAAAELLSPKCLYTSSTRKAVGADDILASFRRNTEWARATFDLMECRSEFEELDDRRTVVTYVVRVVRRGQSHEYRSRLRVTTDGDGRIVRLRPEALPGESEDLERFYARTNVPYTSGDRCRFCNYCLTGLSRDGRCPECGLPLSGFALADEVREHAPQWSRRVATGQFWIMASLVAAALSVFVVVGAEEALERFRAWVPSGSFALVYYSACTLAFAIGLWDVAAPNELISHIPGGEQSRRRLRDCAVVTALTIAAVWVAFALQEYQAVGWIVGLGMPVGAGGLLMWVSITWYLERVARFVGDRFVAGRSRFYRRGLVVAAMVALPSLASIKGGPRWFCFTLLVAPFYLGFVILIAALPAMFSVWFADPAEGAQPDAATTRTSSLRRFVASSLRRDVAPLDPRRTSAEGGSLRPVVPLSLFSCVRGPLSPRPITRCPGRLERDLPEM